MILECALEQFAHHGIQATSIQDIADRAGVSKANVLYHFSTKEHLADEALAPALQALQSLLDSAEGEFGTEEAFMERFVDFLITHRLATHVIIAHPYLQAEISSLRTAGELMGRLARMIDQHSEEEIDQLRIGVAMAGASYALVSANLLGLEQHSDEQLRPLLTQVMLSITHPQLRAGAES